MFRHLLFQDTKQVKELQALKTLYRSLTYTDVQLIICWEKKKNTSFEQIDTSKLTALQIKLISDFVDTIE